MGQSPIPLLSMKAVKSGKKGVCIPIILVRKSQGPWVVMGQNPIPHIFIKTARG